MLFRDPLFLQAIGVQVLVLGHTPGIESKAMTLGGRHAGLKVKGGQGLGKEPCTHIHPSINLVLTDWGPQVSY